MSYFLIEYLEQRVRACDQMIESASDLSSRRIYEATRERYREELERRRSEGSLRAQD